MRRIIDKQTGKVRLANRRERKSSHPKPDYSKIFPCQYRGEPTGGTAQCNQCGHKTERIEVYACEKYQTCTPTLRATGHRWCKACEVFRLSLADDESLLNKPLSAQ